ncbi:MAG: hypothetical protein U5L96_09095 [Owenweeksia sp.]|nr:hypothetical protein [Owenweeksia sp.]
MLWQQHLPAILSGCGPSPIAGIIASDSCGCSPFEVTFDLDSLVSGNPDYLLLSYGDGNADDTLYNWNNLTHTFINATLKDTTYQVQLTAVNSCADSRNGGHPRKARQHFGCYGSDSTEWLRTA